MEDGRNSPVPVHSKRPDIGPEALRAAQVHHLYSQARAGMYGALVGAVVLVAALWEVVPSGGLVGWLAVFFAAQIPRHLLLHAYETTTVPEIEARTWGYRFTLLAAISAALWGVAGFALFPSESFTYQCLLAAFLAGVAASTGFAHTPITEAYLLSIVLILLPTCARILFEGTRVHLTLAVFGLVYACALLGTARSMHRVVTDSIRLRIDKDRLIGSLEQARDELEARVVARTSDLIEKNRQLEDEVSEHKQTEQTLSESEERYRLLAQNSLTGIYIIQENRFTYVNERLAEILGHAPNDMIGRPYWEFLHPLDVARVMRVRFQKEGDGEAPLQFELRAVCAGGETKYLAAYVARIAYKGRPAIMGNIADVTKRRITEELLRASEERYRTLFERAGDAIFILEGAGDQVGKIISANQAAADMHGYTIRELLELNIADLDVPEELTRIPDRISRVVRGEWVKQEIVHRRKDGTVFPVEISAGLLHLPHHHYILAIDRDITDRKRAEEALRNHKETLEALLNATTDVAVLLDREGRIQAVNQEVATRLGRDVQDLISVSAFDLAPREIAARRRERFQRVVNEGAPIREEEIGQDGRTYDTSCYPVFGANGEVEGVAVFARDITQQRIAQETLRRSEEKHRRILETITDGYHEVDLAGKLTLVNDSLCEIMGFPRVELLGLNYKSFVGPEAASRIFKAYNEVYRTGISNPEFTYQIMRKDGTWRDVSVSITLMRDGNGTPCGFRGILRDVTERRQLEEQLRQAVKMEAIGQMAGGVAHDFNNLLTAIMGYASILSELVPKATLEHERLQQIVRAAERAAELTRQLLAFSRRQVLDVRIGSLNDLVRDLESMLERLIGEHIELVTRFDDQAGNVRVDPAQFGQIIMNLVVNARDAMPRGGQLTIATENAVLDETYVRTHAEVKPGDYVMVSVSDTGHGMDPETCARAFDPFFTTKEKGVGTGLGLSTVYGIVKQHEGHITVYSELCRGTTFRVYLPRVYEPAEEVFRATETEKRPRGRETILLVEDEEAVRDLTSEALEMLGYRVYQASSGAEALEIVGRLGGSKVDLLLSDVVLPKMDGKSLYDALEPLQPSMKVLFMSGYTEDFIVHHSVLDPGVNFLPKPFTIKALANKVREVLDGE